MPEKKQTQVENAELASRDLSLAEALVEVVDVFPQLEAMPWWSWPVAAFVASYAVFLKTAADLTRDPGDDNQDDPPSFFDMG